ncbi:hypothetical protein EMIT048CA2_10508 [Pseudomonas chlororaphis]
MRVPAKFKRGGMPPLKIEEIEEYERLDEPTPVRGAHEPRNRAAAYPARPVNDVAWTLIVPEVELGVFAFCRACRHGIRPFHAISRWIRPAC